MPLRLQVPSPNANSQARDAPPTGSEVYPVESGHGDCCHTKNMHGIGMVQGGVELKVLRQVQLRLHSELVCRGCPHGIARAADLGDTGRKQPPAHWSPF